MDVPSTKYVDRRGKSLAYQVIGEGPRAVVGVLEVTAHLDLLWTDPVWVEQCRRIGRLARLVVFQQLGVGLSDRLDRIPTLEEQASDIEAVMDAEGIGSATLFGLINGSMPVSLLAARRPERVDAIVLWDPIPQGWHHEGYASTAGLTAAEAEMIDTAWDDAYDHWGEGRSFVVWNPVIAERNRAIFAMLERASASPSAARVNYETVTRCDVRDVLPLVAAPTRVLHHPECTMPSGPARVVAERIPGATFHELRRSEPWMTLAESAIPVIDHIVEVVSGRAVAGPADRELATFLFTDVVGSTEQVVRHGDAEWAELLRRHTHQIRATVEAGDGELLQLIGDGSLSIFPGPAAAIRAGREIAEQATALELQTRAGVHTGECQRRGGDVSGLAVHVAARVADKAAPGEVWVSRTVRDLVGGSGLPLSPRGAYELKGVPEAWELYAVGTGGDEDVSVTAEPRDLHSADRVALALARRAPRLMQAAARLDGARARRRARNDRSPAGEGGAPVKRSG